tara:strand:- start:47 stop:328 length:282 start_codon:yes stop_codon:yes gene_type:complete
MNNAQAKKIELIQRRTSTAKVVEERGCVFVNWNNGQDHPFNKYSYMAMIGKRGGVKVISTMGGLLSIDDKSHAKTLASLALFDLNIRGTIALI